MTETMKKIIILSGTPGTGKTTVAKELASILSARIIDINKEVIENRFFTNDQERNTKIADLNQLKEHLIRKIQQINSNIIIIEGHYADVVPNELVYKAIILRTHPEKLHNRLVQKKFSIEKISENLQAEILGDCVYHALESYDKNKVFEIDNSELSIKETINKILMLIQSDKKQPKIKNIDWLELLEKNGSLSKYFK